MTAADRSVWLARLESLRQYASKTLLLVVGAGILLLASYCAGQRHERHVEKTAHVDSVRTALVDTIHVVDRQIAVDTVTIRVTRHVADTVRVAYEVAAATVDSAAQQSDSVASSLVIPALHLCSATITADSIAYRAQAVALVDMTHSRDLWQSRALLDEANAPKPQRFGFKSGLVGGVLAALTLIHFIR